MTAYLQQETLTIERHDVSDAFVRLCHQVGTVAWDIETTGLNWAKDTIATCQVAAGKHITVLQIEPGARPSRLCHLLADASVRKVLHHAPFDVRFMSYQWEVVAANLACTKIASKVLSPGLPSAEHSLMPVLARTLGVSIKKDQRLSDWLSNELSPAQLRYASDDVRYLVRLLDAQTAEAARQGVVGELQASFDYLPARVALDLRGVGDVYSY